MGFKEDIGAVVAELRSGTEITGGPYVNLWSGLGTSLKNNQTVASLVGRIAQQVRATAGSLNQASQKAYHASAAVFVIRAQVVVVLKKQRYEELKVSHIGGQLMQLTQLVVHFQQEMQQQHVEL
jgi:hypothetical protein